METVAKPTVWDLKREVGEWVDRLNYIQVEVLDKMAEGNLFEFVRQAEPDYMEFINNYGLHSEFKDATEEEAEKADTETLREFCEDESSFQSFMDEAQDSNYPMWNTCFEFKHSESEEIIQLAVEAGFGVIEGLEPFETILFVSGCGYSFYGAHWIPLWLSLPWNAEKREFYKDVDYSGE
jgi:hypothetical protein